MQTLEQLLAGATAQIKQATNLEELEKIKVDYLGKKGLITEQLKGLGKLSAEDRPKVGQQINVVKQQVHSLLLAKKESLQEELLAISLEKEGIDVTLPGNINELGSMHPITLTLDRIIRIFSKLGFNIADGPEVENEQYNFTALNIPAHHPARAMHDTFYVSKDELLRTHTSPVQIRLMENTAPPIKAIMPGKVYRCDYDMTHSPMFHQMEGLVLDRKTTFADLKGILTSFLEEFFNSKVKLRLRPSYFPFTEPSVEVDVAIGETNIAKNNWLEVLGAGIVHPNVLKNVNIDPEEYTGFAFGMGVERLAMLYYDIDDLRLFFDNDLRFLQQFKA